MPCKKVFFHFCSNIFRNYKFQKLCGASVQPSYYTKSYSNPSTSRSVSQSFHSRHKLLVADVPPVPLPHTQFQQDTQTSMKTTRGTCNSSKSRFALTFALPNPCISTNSLRLLHCFLHINLLCKSYGMGGSQHSQCFFRSYNEGPAVPAPLLTGVSPTLKTSQHRDSTTSNVICSSHSQFSLLHVSYCIIWIVLDAI